MQDMYFAQLGSLGVIGKIDVGFKSIYKEIDIIAFFESILVAKHHEGEMFWALNCQRVFAQESGNN